MSEDVVNNPQHYNQNGIEVIDVIETYAKDDFRLANVLKYVCRCEYKGKKLEDLKKAQWYLTRVIEELEGPREGYTDRECEVFWDGYRCKEQELAERVEDTEPVDFRLDGYYSLVPKDTHVYVQPSPDRIAGDDDAAKRVKANYYQYNADEILGMCKNPACMCPIYADELYVTDEYSRTFCSTVCEQMVHAAEALR